MSTDIRSAYINALLADACYVEGLSKGMDPTDLAKALKANRFPPSLATYISENGSDEFQVGCPA